MSTDGQGTKWHINIAEKFNGLSTAHARQRQTEDRQTWFTTTYSERERKHEFTFAKTKRKQRKGGETRSENTFTEIYFWLRPLADKRGVCT